MQLGCFHGDARLQVWRRKDLVTGEGEPTPEPHWQAMVTAPFPSASCTPGRCQELCMRNSFLHSTAPLRNIHRWTNGESEWRDGCRSCNQQVAGLGFGLVLPDPELVPFWSMLECALETRGSNGAAQWKSRCYASTDSLLPEFRAEIRAFPETFQQIVPVALKPAACISRRKPAKRASISGVASHHGTSSKGNLLCDLRFVLSCL